MVDEEIVESELKKLKVEDTSEELLEELTLLVLDERDGDEVIDEGSSELEVERELEVENWASEEVAGIGQNAS